MERHTPIYFDLPLKPLAIFEGDLSIDEQLGILFRAAGYLQLVGVTGRLMRSDSQFNCISSELSPILERLNLNIEGLLIRAQSFEYPSVEIIIHRSMSPAIAVLVNPFTSAIFQTCHSKSSRLTSFQKELQITPTLKNNLRVLALTITHNYRP